MTKLGMRLNDINENRNSLDYVPHNRIICFFFTSLIHLICWIFPGKTCEVSERFDPDGLD